MGEIVCENNIRERFTQDLDSGWSQFEATVPDHSRNLMPTLNDICLLCEQYHNLVSLFYFYKKEFNLEESEVVREGNNVIPVLSSAGEYHDVSLGLSSYGSFLRLRITQGEVYVSYDDTTSLGSLALTPHDNQYYISLPLAPIDKDSPLDTTHSRTTLTLPKPVVSDLREVVVEYNTSNGKPLSVRATTASTGGGGGRLAAMNNFRVRKEGDDFLVCPEQDPTKQLAKIKPLTSLKSFNPDQSLKNVVSLINLLDQVKEYVSGLEIALDPIITEDY